MALIFARGTHWVDRDRTFRAIVQSANEQSVTIETGKWFKIETVTMSREEFLRDYRKVCVTKDID